MIDDQAGAIVPQPPPKTPKDPTNVHKLSSPLGFCSLGHTIQTVYSWHARPETIGHIPRTWDKDGKDDHDIKQCAKRVAHLFFRGALPVSLGLCLVHEFDATGDRWKILGSHVRGKRLDGYECKKPTWKFLAQGPGGCSLLYANGIKMY